MSFFKKGQSVLDTILGALDEHFGEDYAFVVGGGFSYESIKYLDLDESGDLDLICIANDISKIEAILSNVGTINKVGFDIKRYKFHPLDIELFNKGKISNLRLSGECGGIKTSINFTTIKRLAEIYAEPKMVPINKIAHSKTYAIIISKGTDGSDTLICMFSPEVSGLFNDGEKHFYILDNSWYPDGSYLNAGMISDFIAKGKIVRDFSDKEMNSLRLRILAYYKLFASEEIKASGDWFKMFASDELFSVNFKQRINNEIAAIHSNKAAMLGIGKVFKRGYSDGLISTFSQHFFSADLLSQSTKTFDNSMVEKNELHKISEILEGKSEITKHEYLTVINCELSRLTDLISIAASFNNYAIPKDLSHSNIIYQGITSYYNDNDRVEVNIADHLLRSIEMKAKRYFSSTAHPMIARLNKILIYLEIDTWLYIMKLHQRDVIGFAREAKLDREIIDIIHHRELAS